ncbi:hypothetical protein ACK8P5_09900 [Paenibacillus sp. EC2-1]|uniref:hypothetical protein n=1 Tax=Paenibacillus sp. EC2-1 TaxID=3388665 RepID=UPI003BEED551
MDRHRSRNKGRKNSKAASKDTVFRSKENKENLNSRLDSRSQHSTSKDYYDSQHRAPEDDVLRRSRSRRENNDAQLDEESAPSRSSTHPSQKVRMSKWFVNSLIVIFILLMAGLLIWGLIGAPPLEEIL